ncbi:thiol:disulfide interchange protein DsbA/DsbL [Aquincola sp. S2]|uniref:Thiol:disulfide interchange protein n=1 Tax=Pseudaquabacterium terrae TaxID=2732868 RepID=A0ABX2EBQ6_9BURK|nr:thiol:disulfide interchange protein DsbA/DsbL [Aquabacterium terrae]NRF66345.1 thiol:disulfide interchange protein DsbA/DsbL [Aquabacterium terrae]
MKRREFALGVGGGVASLLAMPACAQGDPAEGKEYTRLQSPVAPGTPAGKIEAVEFFGYWCPHCHAFEPALDAWVRKLPADVVFRRVPVAFNAPQEPYQKLFYALEALGQLEAMHRKVFNAIHVDRVRLDKDSELQKLAGANGIDYPKLKDTMASFSVATKCNQAKQLANAYKIDGVPTLAVQGRYMTSVGQAGSHEGALRVMDGLIQKARKG